VNSILERDPNALVIIMGDHGGFVGFDYTHQIYSKTSDRDLIYSIFSAQLSILWPNGLEPDNLLPVKSPVNVFRTVFSVLGDRPDLMDHLEKDESFVILNSDAPKGVYKYLNHEGEVVFQKQ